MMDPPLLGPRLKNAMYWPSEDQTGIDRPRSDPIVGVERVEEFGRVNREVCPRARSCSQMSERPGASVSPRPKATFVPSGEIAGFCWRPGSPTVSRAFPDLSN